MKVVVLGATGNAGTALLTRLQAAPEVTEIVGVSRHGPDRGGAPYEGVAWERIDVADPGSVPALERVMSGADVVVDLVWVIRPNRDDDFLRSVNVAGNRRVFEAAGRVGVPHLVYASSVGAYGRGIPGDRAEKDRRFDESYPVLGVPTSHYARQKAEVEAVLDEVAARFPDMLVTRLRPALIFQEAAGPEIKDYFLGALVPARLAARLRLPVLPFPRGVGSQAVGAADVAEAYWTVIRERAGGAFNVAAEPALGAREAAQVLGARVVLPLPRTLVRAALAVAWRLRLLAMDPGWIDMAYAVPVMDSARIRALGWSETVDAISAVRSVLDHFDGPEGLGNAAHRSRSPLE